MKKPFGPLGWTAEERQEYERTGRRPERTVEAPDGPPGITLTTLPSQEYMRGFLDALREKARPRGAPSKRDEHLILAAECVGETGGRIDEACKLYVVRSPAVQKETARRQFWRALKTLQTVWNGD
jgi:hypothetical protein